LKLFNVSLFFLSRLMSPLSKDETRRDSSLTLMICPYTVIKTVFMYFCVWLQNADVTETRNVIPSLEFKT